MSKFRIGIVAPASRMLPEIADRVRAFAGAEYPGAQVYFHPQCFGTAGHFAGSDAARAGAFLEIANDPAFDALWIARGGYGSGRIAEVVLRGLEPAARRKTYLGYSDAGFLLAGLYKHGYRVAHGPVAYDIRRDGGEAAVRRALDFLMQQRADTLEPTVLSGVPVAAFNLIVLSQMIGTPLQPDLAGHVLMLEEVSEYLYAIDRAMFHVTSNPDIRRVAGLKLGRCSNIPGNDPPFGQTEEEIAQHWCTMSGIKYLGRADIGHDADNKVVPFGAWSSPTS
jgi:muramoyltetrapeptide carboxypeptidase